jgi:hypothetical protein
MLSIHIFKNEVKTIVGQREKFCTEFVEVSEVVVVNILVPIPVPNSRICVPAVMMLVASGSTTRDD